ncbi:MAG: hypothetical protein CYPHOPRED_002097 [Cyphobasidiales sp. Tagirdzhanova-0007]|nr:MAG: hypothetical protein CYPHOPRED_002097 [Cyphobasidiales sp. Tagirdzhanova-0007]
MKSKSGSREIAKNKAFRYQLAASQETGHCSSIDFFNDAFIAAGILSKVKKGLYEEKSSLQAYFNKVKQRLCKEKPHSPTRKKRDSVLTSSVLPASPLSLIRFFVDNGDFVVVNPRKLHNSPHKRALLGVV